MHRIDADGHVNNRFVAQNPSTGQRATATDAPWFNSVQEEICAVIEGAGITLDKQDTNQLLDAIQALISTGGALLLEGKWLLTNQYDATRFKPAEGQTLNRADFPAAWTAIQASGLLAADATDKNNNPGKFGRGDGATTFEMPDLRDHFLRVYKAAKAGALGPSLGGFKANQNKEHSHAISVGIAVTNTSTTGNGGDNQTQGSTGTQGGNEAVPDHTSLVFVIRMK